MKPKKKARKAYGSGRARTEPAERPEQPESADEDAIYERILAAIFEHRLQPGTKLGEDRLARIFGVSRARIRRMLPRLAHERLVTLEPNRGAFVAKPSVSEARDIFDARRLIEPGIVERFMQVPQRSAIARLREHVAAERKARAAEDKPTIIRLSGEFHVLMAQIAGNTMLARTMHELTSLTCLIIALYDSPTVPHCRSDEHAELVDAIAAGDRARATRLMVDHLNHVEQGLDLSLDETAAVDLEQALA